MSASHSLTSLSPPPVASVLPSREKQSDITTPEWALNVKRSVPVAMSRMRTMPSRLPVASVLPSGAKASDAENGRT